jgi:phosphoribosylamine---glycine ligase
MGELLNIAVIGAGGREYSLSRAIASSSLVGHVYRLPGNGTVFDKTSHVNIKATDIEGIKNFALENKIDFIVVGPEDPLVLGLVDVCEAAGIKCIGPRQNAAILEGSKIFTRVLLKEHKIPSAKFEVFEDIGAARAYIRDMDYYPIVIKMDGLAAGKGAMVCHGPNDVDISLRRIERGEFKKAGKRFVVEEFLEGEEASKIYFVDKNRNVMPLKGAQDHKAIFDDDKGDNTGGTGAYAWAPVLSPEVEERVLERIVKPTIRAMAEKGRPFTGFLYVGLMIDQYGNPFVVEFNVRLGDPETQPILALLESDIVEIFLAALAGDLDKVQVKWNPGVAVCVVMMEKGYPGAYEKGHEIFGIEKAMAMGAIVDHAGTKVADGKILTDGGRVLGITALGENHAIAIAKAYEAVRKISWFTEYYRTDIGHKALRR